MKRLAALVSLVVLSGCESLDGEPSVAPATVGAAVVSSMPEQRGAAYAQANCASCHAIGRTGESPLGQAPAFRSLGLRYPVSDLAEAFAEGIVTAHPAMPQFEMTPTQNADLIAYLESIQASGRR